MERRVELGPPLREEIYPLRVEPRYSLTPSDSETPKSVNLHFGNSGVLVAFSNKYSSQLHFSPDYENAAPKGNSDKAVQKRVKFARMFAAGMLALIDYFQHFDLENSEKKFKYVFEHSDGNKTLEFSTNPTMLAFAQKMFGNDYFVLNEYKTLQKKKIEPGALQAARFKLKNFLEDLESNPELLANAKKFADPEKLREIKSVQY